MIKPHKKYSSMKGLHTRETFKKEKHLLTWDADGLSFKKQKQKQNPETNGYHLLK